MKWSSTGSEGSPVASSPVHHRNRDRQLATLSQLRRALASPAELRPDVYSWFCLPNLRENPRGILEKSSAPLQILLESIEIY